MISIEKCTKFMVNKYRWFKHVACRRTVQCCSQFQLCTNVVFYLCYRRLYFWTALSQWCLLTRNFIHFLIDVARLLRWLSNQQVSYLTLFQKERICEEVGIVLRFEFQPQMHMQSMLPWERYCSVRYTRLICTKFCHCYQRTLTFNFQINSFP